MAPYDWILFDAGGTLLGTNTDTEHWYEQFFVDACAEQGCVVTVQQVHDALSRASQTRSFARRCSSPEETREFWHHIYSSAFRDLISGCDADDMARYYIDRFERGEYVQLFPDTMPALVRLHEFGIRMGVVSNFGTYLADFLERTGIAGYFEFLVISAAEGCEKPHPDIFDIALARAGVPARNILFVGDSPKEDYEPAARHGMVPVLVDRYGKYRQTPMQRIATLSELRHFT